jgi:hypothetical protein
MNDDDDYPPPRLGALPESLLAWKNGWTEMDETTQAFSVIKISKERRFPLLGRGQSVYC